MPIDIKAELALLREIQMIDIQLRTIEDQIEAIPVKMEEAQSGWVQIQEELKKNEEAKSAADKEKRTLDAGLEDALAHLRDRETKLYTIKTNKEYQAALKEIADGKRANKEREDALLKVMEKIETFSKKITQLSGEAAEKESEFKKEDARLSQEKEGLSKEREGFAAAIAKLKEKVERTLLDQYDFIRSRYNDPLVAVHRGICQGCNINVPPQMYIELLKCLKIHFCPNCHRLIYADDQKDKETGDEG